LLAAGCDGNLTGFYPSTGYELLKTAALSGQIEIESSTSNKGIEYDFTPAVAPEPSLFFVTGAGFLGLIAMRIQHRRAEAWPDISQNAIRSEAHTSGNAVLGPVLSRAARRYKPVRLPSQPAGKQR